jgi:PAT family beta-lactamase induction signal transducer AmpG
MSLSNSQGKVADPPCGVGEHRREWPAPWMFGVLILPLGIYVGFITTPLPFLLGKAGIPVDQIARISSLVQLPAFLFFLWAPLIDVKLRRRAWLVISAAAAALCVGATIPLLGSSHVGVVTALLLAGGVPVTLVQSACGGLMVATQSAQAQSQASAWNSAGNWGAGAIGGAIVLWLAARVSAPLVGLALAAMIALPASLAFAIPETPPKPAPWFRGRLAEIAKELWAIVRAPERRWGVLLLASPCATGAAVFLLPAIASRYGVGGSGVMWMNGVAGGLLMASGSLCGALVPGAWDRRLTYVGAALTNALAAIVLLAADRPSIYFAGTTLYLITTGFCIARFTALLLDVVGPGSHDAGTRYSVPAALGNLPLVYMIWLDGVGFRHFGTRGLLWTDAAANLVVFAIVVLVFVTYGMGLRRSLPAQAE